MPVPRSHWNAFRLAPFQDDILAGDEYRDRVIGRPKLTPMQRLVLALIEGAWYDLHEPHRTQGERHRGLPINCKHCGAVRWVAGDETPLAFEIACDVLRIESEWLRRAMLKAPEKGRTPRTVHVL